MSQMCRKWEAPEFTQYKMKEINWVNKADMLSNIDANGWGDKMAVGTKLTAAGNLFL